MDAAIPASGKGTTWFRHGSSCLPEGLQCLALPPLFLPDEVVEEIHSLAELTRLECMDCNGYWPSLDLIGLKVRGRCRWMLNVRPALSCYNFDADSPGRHTQITALLSSEWMTWRCTQSHGSVANAELCSEQATDEKRGLSLEFIDI